MKTNNLQYRSLSTEFEADDESRRIHGLAIPVNSRSAFIHDFDGDYYEIILPSAINEELIRNNDIKMYIDHDASRGTYARSKFGVGSLNLMVTERGLEFEFEAPDTVFGQALLEGIRRGDYDAISWAFKPGEERWGVDETGEPLHYVMSFERVAEISILSLTPAFAATEVELRSLHEFKDELEQQQKEALEKVDAVDQMLNELYAKYLDITY